MRTMLLAAAAAAALLAGPALAKPMPEFAAVDEASFAEPSGDQVLALSTTIDAPPHAVWQALSTADGWKSFAVKMAQVDFRQGGVIETSYDAKAQPGQPGNIRNQILAIVPRRLLVIRNVQAPPGFAHPEEFGRTITAIELVPDGPARTQVRLWAAGYKPAPAYRDLFAMFRMGDAWTLDELRKRFIAHPASGAEPPAPAARAMAGYPHVADLSRASDDGTRLIQQQVVIHAPVSALWAGFTETKAYEAWVGATGEVVPGVGGHMETVLDPKGHIGDPTNLRHEILAYAPERLLVFRNVQAPPGLPGAEVFGDIRILVQFEDLGGGDTRVTLSQTGYRQGAGYDALWAFFHPHNAELLETLKKSFESRTFAQETPHG